MIQGPAGCAKTSTLVAWRGQSLLSQPQAAVTDFVRETLAA
ncbi:hypothetical protein [Cupriavidus necator]|nr:hypothetical protein [Cupriavidus necator]